METGKLKKFGIEMRRRLHIKSLIRKLTTPLAE